MTKFSCDTLPHLSTLVPGVEVAGNGEDGVAHVNLNFAIRAAGGGGLGLAGGR